MTDKEFKNAGSIVIIQVNRMGDLIQTYQSVIGLKRLNPKISLSLIAREQFTSQLRFLLDEVFDNIYLYPENVASTNATDIFKSELKLINDLLPSVCVNLSFCPLSQQLAKEIQAKFHIGPYRNDQNEICISDSWGQFVFSNIMGTNLNPFNVVDIFKKMLGNTVSLDSDQENTVQREEIVTIHPFASNIKKKWGLSKWAESIYNLLKKNKNLNIYIVGAKDEQELASNLISTPLLSDYQERIISKAGQFSVEQTFSLLKKSRLFIGNDSMVSHLAALAKTPTLIISLGSVRPSETSPYQLQSLTLSPKISCYPCLVETPCELLPCHSKINYHFVTQVAQHVFENGTFDNLSLDNIEEHYYNNLNIHANFIVNNQIVLRKVDLDTYSADQYFRQIYEIIWSFILEDAELNLNHPTIAEGAIQAISSTIEGIDKAFQLYQHGMKTSAQLYQEVNSKRAITKAIKSHLSKLNEIDQLACALAKKYPYIAPIILYYYTQKTNIPSNNLSKIADANLLSYHHASNTLSILLDLTSKSLEHYNKKYGKQKSPHSASEAC